MKKYFTSPEYKSRNKKHAENSLESRIRFKLSRRIKNRLESNLNKRRKAERRETLKHKYAGYNTIVAPEVFSLIMNPEGTISFISKLEEAFKQNKIVFISMRKVTDISYDAIIVLLSIMVKFHQKGIPFNGDFPLNMKARKIFMDSGFINLLFDPKRYSKYVTYDEMEDRYTVQQIDNCICTHAWKSVDSKLSSQMIEIASENLWGERRRIKGVQRTLIELMQNTNNHAEIGTEGTKHWWLSVNYLKDEEKVTFSFVDFGVGIFKSLNNKTPGSKLFDAIKQFFTNHPTEDNAQLLNLILIGELHKTITKKYYRGKGLPGIFDAYSREQIRNLYIITNNAFADVANNYYHTMESNFNGTFVYWEIDKNTKSWRIDD